MKYYKDINNEIFAYDDEQVNQGFGKDLTSITFAEVEAINTQKATDAFNALSYQEKRRAEYPSMTDYLDGIVKGDTAQVQTYIDACNAVKLKYPKV